MPPPGFFIDIPSLPFTRVVTPVEFNAANEIWFRRIVTTKEALGGFATRDLGTFIPETRIYASDGTTLLHTIPRVVNNQFAWYFIFQVGTYYIKITNGLVIPIINNFTNSFASIPILTSVQQGSLVINDDTAGFPATVIYNNQFVGIYEPVPAGEIVAVLPTGESLWHDSFGKYSTINKLALFDANLVYITSVDTVAGLGGNVPLISHDSSKFYVYDPTDRSLNTVTTAGVVASVTGPLPIGNKFGLGIKRDGSIAYYSKGKFDGIIYRWNIPGNAPLSNLYSITGFVPGSDSLSMTPNNNPGEILVLSDNTIITYWHDLSATTTHILHLTEAGTIINDFPFTDAVEGYIDHISYGIADSLGTITVWFQDTPLIIGQWQTLLLSAGTLTLNLLSDMFNAGINLHGNSSLLAGPSESCGMITYLLQVTPPPTPPLNPGSGIYKIVPGKHNDTLWNDDLTASFDVKIPNPFGKTGLIGE